jgi:ribosomal protein L37AE/L43A
MNTYTFKPTWLYIKRHKITGKKYFGKTTKSDPIKYPGSGHYWTRHINKHGKDLVETIWTQHFTDKQECTEYALKFSIENNIVESTEWANQMLEDGLTGNGSPGRKATQLAKETVSANNKKRLANGTHIFLDKEFQKEKSKRMIEDGTHPVYRLHVDWVCEHCGRQSRGKTQYRQHIKSKNCLNFFKPKQTSKDRVAKGTHNFLGSELQKKRVANGTHPSQVTWTCEHCGNSGKGKGVFTRFHGLNCKSLVQK